ncbi:MAG: Hpt domain-containing protein, partial [Myxococcota bacterium]
DEEGERLLRARDVDGLHRFGHTAKGSFLQFGYPEGGAIGEALLRCARDGDWEGAASEVAALRRLLTDVREALARRHAR